MKTLPKYLTKKEISTLINSIGNLRDKIIMLFLYNTGARNSELINVRVEDLNFENNTIRIVRGKGAKDRTVTVSQDFATTLKAYVKDRKKGTLFLSNWQKKYTPRGIQKKIKRIAEKSAINGHLKVKPHTIRHTHAVHALDSGVNIVSIKKQLGHENLRTTMIYTEISDSMMKKDFEEHKPFEIIKEKE